MRKMTCEMFLKVVCYLYTIPSMKPNLPAYSLLRFYHVSFSNLAISGTHLVTKFGNAEQSNQYD